MLRREAAGWLARLQSGRDPDDERKFRKWHDGDPARAAAFARVRRSYDQAGLLRSSPAFESERPGPALRKPRRELVPALAAAAALVLLIPIGLLLVRGAGSPFGGTDRLMLMTKVGEIRQVRLADGSKIILDTATRIEVEIGRSRRHARVKYGRARFQIARGAPFVVETAAAAISARAGVIDVEELGSGARVRVLSGAADVTGTREKEQARVSLAAGETAAVGPAGAERIAAAPAATDWTRGMLQFDATPLAEAVAIANRYSGHRIILGGNLEALRVTGAFRAGDTTGLARALATAFALSLEERSDGDLILSPSEPSHLHKKRGG